MEKIYSKPLAIWKILSKLNEDEETLEKIVGTEGKTTMFGTFKKSIKEQIFKTVGHKFGIQREVRLGAPNIYKIFEGELLGKIYMTPNQFLFVSPKEKVYGALPKNLKERWLKKTIEDYKVFHPEINYISKDKDALLMDISCWHGTDFFIPHSNYSHLIVKLEDRKMSFSDFVRTSYSNHDHRFKILNLTKERINYTEITFDGDEFLDQTIIKPLKFSREFSILKLK